MSKIGLSENVIKWSTVNRAENNSPETQMHLQYIRARPCDKLCSPFQFNETIQSAHFPIESLQADDPRSFNPRSDRDARGNVELLGGGGEILAIRRGFAA